MQIFKMQTCSALILGAADLTNVDFSGANLKQVYIKNSKMENIVTNSDTKD